MLYKLAMATVVVMGLSCVAPLLKAEEFQSDFSLIMHAIARDDLEEVQAIVARYKNNSPLLHASGLFNGERWTVLCYILALNRAEILHYILAAPNTVLGEIDTRSILFNMSDLGYSDKPFNQATIIFMQSVPNVYSSVVGNLLRCPQALKQYLEATPSLMCPESFARLVTHYIVREHGPMSSLQIILDEAKKRLSQDDFKNYVCQIHEEVRKAHLKDYCLSSAYQRVHSRLDGAVPIENCGICRWRDVPFNTKFSVWWNTQCNSGLND